VRLWKRRSGRLVGRRIAGDECQPFRPRVEAVAAQHPPHAVGRHDDPAPLRARQLGGDPIRPNAGVTEAKRDDPLLDHRRELTGHPRPAPLPGPQHLQAVPVDLPLPPVVGRAVHPKAPTCMAHACATGQIEQRQPVAVQNVMIRHAAHVLSRVLEDPESLSRTADVAATQKGGDVRQLSTCRSTPRVSGDLGERPN
jgi:hypothetical protein